MSISVEQFANLNDQQLYQLAEFQTAMTSDKKDIGNNPLIYVLERMFFMGYTFLSRFAVLNYSLHNPNVKPPKRREKRTESTKSNFFEKTP